MMARVRGVMLSLFLSHTFPDDLEIVLQSPTGTTVVVMNDAGGGTDLTNAALFANLPKQPAGHWAGPVRSGYGLHLVLVREIKPGKAPELAEVYPQFASRVFGYKATA